MSIEELLEDRVFHRGNQGPVVKAIQLKLATLGYPLTGSGSFGGKTDTAVRDFQMLSQLTVDGAVGPETARALDQAGTPVKPPVITHIERPVWVLTGLQYLQLRESVGRRDNPTILKWALEEGGSIAQNYTHDAIPWCALFANMILTKNEIRGTESLWALDFNSPKKWPCVKLNGPAVGAFAPMVRSGGGHITIVVGRTRDGYVAGLGGNQSDAVTIGSYPEDRPLNYWWPASQPLPSAVGFDKLPLINSSGVPISEA